LGPAPHHVRCITETLLRDSVNIVEMLPRVLIPYNLLYCVSLDYFTLRYLTVPYLLKF